MKPIFKKILLITEAIASAAVAAVVIVVPTYNSLQTTADNNSSGTTNNPTSDSTNSTPSSGDPTSTTTTDNPQTNPNTSSSSSDSTGDSKDTDSSGDTTSDNNPASTTTQSADFINNDNNQYVNYSNGSSATTSMTFAGYNQDGSGSKDAMNAIVSKITPTVSDVTTTSSNSVWTPGTDSSGNTTYTLVANSDGTYNDGQTSSDAYQYIENFIGITSNWYNEWYNSESSVNALNAQLVSNDVDYDTLSNYTISLVLDLKTTDSSYTNYTFSLSLAPKDSTTATYSYNFVLYTGTDFGTTFTNGNRGAAEVPVDNYSDKYYVGTNVENSYYPQIRFASYYNDGWDSSSVTANMNTIVKIITPNVSDVTNDSTGTWTSSSQSDGSVVYTLTKYNDGSSGVGDYQYIKNFMGLDNSSAGWKNVDSTRNLSSITLNTSDLNYTALSNYDISLQLVYYSATSYNFTYTITPKTNPTTTTGYRFILYTYYTYTNNSNKF